MGPSLPPSTDASGHAKLCTPDEVSHPAVRLHTHNDYRGGIADIISETADLDLKSEQVLGASGG
jgi:hypothetical protein